MNGKRYRFNSSHRHWILYEMLYSDDYLTKEEKMIKSFELIFIDPVDLENIGLAYDFMLWFYNCGKPQKRGCSSGSEGGSSAFSYDYDDGYIYGAFLSQYQINLRDADLHWWEFRALFRSLEQDRRFTEITGFRTIDIPAKMSPEMKNYYRRMKEQFAIPLSFEEQAEIDELTAELLKY